MGDKDALPKFVPISAMSSAVSRSTSRHLPLPSALIADVLNQLLPLLQYMYLEVLFHCLPSACVFFPIVALAGHRPANSAAAPLVGYSPTRARHHLTSTSFDPTPIP